MRTAIAIILSAAIASANPIIFLSGPATPPAAGASFTHVRSVESGSVPVPDETIPTVGAGNLVVVLVRWEGAVGATTTMTLGSDTMTGGTRVSTNGSDHHAQLFYLLSATGGSSVILDIAGGAASSSYVVMAYMEFSVTGGPAQFDTQNTGSANSGTSLASGNITTAGTGLVVAGASSYSGGGQAWSARNIGGVAADGTLTSSVAVSLPYASMWYDTARSLSGQNATATVSINDGWICNVMAFK